MVWKWRSVRISSRKKYKVQNEWLSTFGTIIFRLCSSLPFPLEQPPRFSLQQFKRNLAFHSHCSSQENALPFSLSFFFVPFQHLSQFLHPISVICWMRFILLLMLTRTLFCFWKCILSEHLFFSRLLLVLQFSSLLLVSREKLPEKNYK